MSRALPLATLLLGVALLLGALALAGPAHAATPDFTWSMAPRVGATARVGVDRLPVMKELHDPAYVQAKSFTVLIDACKLAGPRATYVWSGASVTPRPMPGRGRVPLDDRPEGTCLFQTRLPQGEHQVTARVADGPRAGTKVTRTITVRDYLIVSLGDSAAAGEGSPDVMQQFTDDGIVRRGPLWKQRPCHRSINAGSARAALQIERDPKTSVTFVHLACTGAKVGEGLLSKYSGGECCQHDDRSATFGQLAELKEIVGTRRIDALVISIGINDIGFGQVASACVLAFQDCRDLEGAVSARLDALWNGTNGSYADLRDAIRNIGLNVAPAAIHLTEYPDITTDADGAYSGFKDACLPFQVVCAIDMTPAENVWAAEVVDRLNAKINDAARGFGWDVVDGATNGFRGHGLSAGKERWANTPFDSVRVQGPWPPLCPLPGSPADVASYPALYTVTGLGGTALYSVVCNLWEGFNQTKTLGPLHPNPRGYEYLGRLIADRLLGGAQITKYEGPGDVFAGSRVPISITLTNTGIIPWTPSEYALGASGAAGRTWGVDSIPLARRVEGGEEVTLTFTLTAPAEPGEYYLGWQMRRGSTAFGKATGLLPVTVKPAAGEPRCVTLHREQTRLLTRIHGLENQLKLVSTDDPDWRAQQFELNAELGAAKAELAEVTRQLAEEQCS